MLFPIATYDALVDSSHLTPDQVARLRLTLGRELRYLNNLCGRMQTLRFPPDDGLCRAAQRARDALQDLYTAAHYCGCSSGVGKGGNAEL
jgi:hypothetical protein